MEFFDLLVRYEVALWSAIDRELRQRGEISLSTLHALRFVDRYDGRARVHDLSGDIGITVGAASKLVDRLDRDGLTRRTPHPEDRRSSLIALTGAGQQALASGAAGLSRALAEAFGGEDLASVTAALGRLQSRLHNADAGAAA